MKCDCDDWTSQPRTLLAEKHKWVHCPWCGKELRATAAEALVLRTDILERIENLESELHRKKAEIACDFEALEVRVKELEDDERGGIDRKQQDFDSLQCKVKNTGKWIEAVDDRVILLESVSKYGMRL
jgi:hypothetical protein